MFTSDIQLQNAIGNDQLYVYSDLSCVDRNISVFF